MKKLLLRVRKIVKLLVFTYGYSSNVVGPDGGEEGEALARYW